MRRTRWLLLAAIALILTLVGIAYVTQRAAQARRSPALPSPLPAGVDARATEWRYAHNVDNRRVYEVVARDFRQIREPAVMELDGVELTLYHKDGKGFDRVTSEKAEFNPAEGVMFAPGEVEITMGLADQPAPARERLLKIRSSGVRFETKTSRATTDQPTAFTFDRGQGTSVGAVYDSATQEIQLRKDAELRWKGAGGKTMVVQAGEATYKEAESKVYLGPWSRLLRDSLTLNATQSVVTLDKGEIRLVEAQQAQGTDRQPKRQVEYAAAQLTMQFADDGEVKVIDGTGNARLASAAPTTRTTMTSERVHMEFATSPEGSQLQKAEAHGKSIVEAAPVARPGAPLAETRLLRSDVIEMAMKPGGELIDRVVTHTPAQVEFVPNQAGQRRRTLDGERVTLTYGADNQIEQFRAVQVSTRTEGLPTKGQPTPPPALTWSKDFLAHFDPKTGQMTRLEQWEDFRYEEGTRKAKANRAVLEAPSDLMTLDGAARMWDPTGSTAANKILLAQKSGDLEAQGNVTSTRQPDKPKKGAASSPLSSDAPLQAKADRMTTREDNQKIRYEGNAVLWQGANRVTGETIDIDRKADRLTANGKVVSQFVDQPPAPVPGKPASKQPAAPVYTIVRAPQLTYLEAERQAHYQGGVVLVRPGLTVESRELRAYLSKDEGSSLEKALSDGQVKIVQVTPERTRTGTGEHGEYHVKEERILLSGGEPQLVDSVRGTTRGQSLTYFANSDRLLVEGEAGAPAVSRIRKKK